MCFKVWEELTIPTFSSHPPYGMKAGQANPRFFDAGCSRISCWHRIEKRGPSLTPGHSYSNFSATACSPRTLWANSMRFSDNCPLVTEPLSHELSPKTGRIISAA